MASRNLLNADFRMPNAELAVSAQPSGCTWSGKSPEISQVILYNGAPKAAH
jgi:hypothetical protein